MQPDGGHLQGQLRQAAGARQRIPLGGALGAAGLERLQAVFKLGALALLVFEGIASGLVVRLVLSAVEAVVGQPVGFRDLALEGRRSVHQYLRSILDRLP
ncbi:MAG: hypothetical protein KA132_09890 [Thauera sp.]|nr:hypothetical protein [Thauera sp.]